jgi:diguanylate cyclase (GGDEF)-like protein
VGDGVYGVDLKGMLTFMNPAARETIGANALESVNGRSAHQLFHYAHADGSEIPEQDCPLQNAYASGDRMSGWETVFWHPDRGAIPVECTVYPLRIQNRHAGSVVAFRDISDRRSLEQLRWQATHDPLTDLINRRHFEEILDTEINRLKRSREHSALLYVDLDRFKFINDTAGHHAGDNLLIDVARKLKTRRRDADVLSRLGGDEFTAILRNIDPENLYYVANSFREVLANNRFSYGGKTYKINASVGVTVLSASTQSVEQALDAANQACLLAKRKGRDQTYVYLPSDDQQTVETFATGWSAQLRDALQNNRFVLMYQPIVPMSVIDLNNMPTTDGDLWAQLPPSSRSQSMYEVLLRMLGPENELIPPEAFIASAERFDLMQEIDLWVISNAVRRLEEVSDGDHTVNLTINLSSHTLQDETIPDMLKDLFSNSRIPAERIIFEVTETSAITNMEAAQKFIRELNKFGCRFALDDFGSGFSTFSYLRSLPLDFVKIDGQFIRTMTSDSVDRAMVSSMIDIGHSMQMKTVAEYVENPEVIAMLRECGVDYVQGHYIARPFRNLVT